MADYRSACCPNCGTKLISTYRLDLPSMHTALTKCPKGHHCTVTYGKGRLEVAEKK